MATELTSKPEKTIALALGDQAYQSGDIPAASQYYEKAALQGDICATYKLGDMYRNGDLQKDLDFSELLYRKAYEAAEQAPDLYSYPDAALRILRYCRSYYTMQELRGIAGQIIFDLQTRISEGDRYSNDLYREAREIQKELG